MTKKSKRLCFVLMPFRDELKDVYDLSIKQACLDAGFEYLRVDEVEGIFNINRKIIENIFISDVIVADLTDLNPNVLYEMGVAHTIANKTIMIIQKHFKLPFDINIYKCIQYEQTEAGLSNLKQGILEALESLDQWRTVPANPVQDYKPTDVFALINSADALNKKVQEKERLIKRKEKQLQRIQKELMEARIQSKKATIRNLKSPKYIFRSRSISLSRDNVSAMLKNYNFFSSNLNNEGIGIHHDFEEKSFKGDSIVFDYETGLIWQQSGSNDNMTFNSTNKWLNEINDKIFAGYRDWRLPTLEEATSLMEREKMNSDLHINSIFDKTQIKIWTADSATGKPGKYWVVDYLNGTCDPNFHDIKVYVRAVRSGQSSP